MATHTERIKQEAYDLITQLYGEDTAKMRRNLIEFHAKAMKLSTGADSILDPLLLKLIGSKHTTLITVSVLLTVLGTGCFLGSLL